MPGVLLAMLRRAFSSGAAPLRLAGKAVEADATDRDQSPLVARTLETQTIDILVNNAGFNVRGRAMDRITVGDWHALDGLIINVSSIAGRRALTLSGAAYCAAKRGVNALGEMINLEEHERGIRCTNICPGEVVTEILDKRDAPPSEAQRARMLQPEDVAAAALYIACLPPRAHVTELTITGKTTLPECL
ncbi:hypothetical protein JL721_6988 [Aureococcus anophagefferens]|nr:hypothetical protein JL721_6988 [Aureococcus anophagefferens]